MLYSIIIIILAQVFTLASIFNEIFRLFAIWIMVLILIGLYLKEQLLPGYALHANKLELMEYEFEEDQYNAMFLHAIGVLGTVGILALNIFFSNKLLLVILYDVALLLVYAIPFGRFVIQKREYSKSLKAVCAKKGYQVTTTSALFSPNGTSPAFLVETGKEKYSIHTIGATRQTEIVRILGKDTYQSRRINSILAYYILDLERKMIDASDSFIVTLCIGKNVEKKIHHIEGYTTVLAFSKSAIWKTVSVNNHLSDGQEVYENLLFNENAFLYFLQK